MKIPKKWPLFLSVLALSACGGGGGSSSSPKHNQSPTVSISGSSQIESGATISLSAIASDSDGSIVSYSWATDSDTAVTLGDNKSATLSVTSANVSVDTTVKLTLTVTDNQGASTQANLQVKIAAKKTSLAISGLVTDAVVPNANVTATVRDLTFTTTADADGKYTLNLSVDDAHLNDLVLITADGGSSKPTLKLASQLPSIQTLLVQAGSDKQLDANENFSVNVTNVTTAEYALMVTRGSYYGVPFLGVNNDLELKNLSVSVREYEKYWLAALIKIVSDMDVSLPTDAKTTLDLVLDKDLTNELQASINNATPELIDQVITAIKSDASIVQPQQIDYRGTYIMYKGIGDTDWELTIDDNNKGEAKTRFGNSSFTWTQDGQKLDIHFDEPIDLKQQDYLGNWVATSLEIYIDGVLTNVNVTMLRVILGNDGTILSEHSDFKSVTLASTAKGLSLEKEKLVGDWIQGTEGSASLFKLNSDDSVNLNNLDGTDMQAGLTWAPSEKGFTVFRDGKKLTDYYVLNDLGVGYSFVAINWSSLSSDEVFAYAWNGKLIRQQQLSVAKADLRGTYVGTGGRIYTLSNDDIIEGLSSRTSPWNYSSADSSWTSYIYQDKNSLWLGYCDQAANKSCKVFRKTVVKVLASANDSYHLLNTMTEYDFNGEKSYSNSWFETWSRIPTPSYFDYWFYMSTYRREFFQQTAAGIKVWHFRSGSLEINDRSDDSSSFQQTSIPTIIAKGKLLYTRDGVEKTLELISVSDEGIVVCEYNAGASCTKGSEITLSNRTPAAISYKVSVGGSVEYESLYARYSDPMTLFGNVATYIIVPDQGYTIGSVTGCDGKLNGITYTTASVKDKCTITASFVKTSMQ